MEGLGGAALETVGTDAMRPARPAAYFHHLHRNLALACLPPDRR
jgi:hypothetical protein